MDRSDWSSDVCSSDLLNGGKGKYVLNIHSLLHHPGAAALTVGPCPGATLSPFAPSFCHFVGVGLGEALSPFSYLYHAYLFVGLCVVLVQLLSLVRHFATPWTAARTPGFPSFTISQNLLKLVSIESVMPSNLLILCRPLLLLPSILPSIRVFSNESALRIRWPKFWSFSFSISPSSEHSGLISFRMDWLDLPADQGTLRNLLQHHNSKASILQLYSPTLTSIHDYWKSHSFDYMDLCWQTNISVF